MALRGYLIRRRAVLFRRDAEAAAAPLPDGFTFAQIDADAFAHGALFAERGRAARFRDRLAAGHRCFGFHNTSGAPVAYLWLTRRGAGKRVPIGGGVSIVPGRDDAYVWDCRTAADVQGRGLYRTGLRLLAGRAASEGARHLWIDCAPDNAASMAGIAAAGFAEAARWQVLRCGPLRLFHAQGGPTRCGGAGFPVPLHSVFTE